MRNNLIYWGGRARKWVSNESYEVEITTKYRLDSQVDANQFDKELARSLGVRSDDNGKFTFDKKKGMIDSDIEIIPEYASSVSQGGKVTHHQNSVSRLTVTMSCNPDYRQLTSSLLDLQDIERNLLEQIVSVGAHRNGSVIKCEMPAKPTLQKLIGKGDIDTIRGSTEDGTRIDVSRNEIQIHADPDSAVTSVVRRAIVHYA